MTQPFATSPHKTNSEGFRPSEFLSSPVEKTGRCCWLPRVDGAQTAEPQEVTLIVNLYRKRKKTQILYIDTPQSNRPAPECFQHKNILAEARVYSDFLEENPSRTHAMIAKRFGVNRERVSRHINLIQKLPSEFIEKAIHWPDTILKRNAVLKIARIKNNQKQQATIERLLLTGDEKIP